jgi:hypothetical protein
MVGVVILFGLIFVGIMAVLYGTSVRNKWGVNFNPVRCPRCDTKPSGIRMPRSLREVLWGGWTCPKCGARIDKWWQELV